MKEEKKLLTLVVTIYNQSLDFLNRIYENLVDIKNLNLVNILILLDEPERLNDIKKLFVHFDVHVLFKENVSQGKLMGMAAIKGMITTPWVKILDPDDIIPPYLVEPFLAKLSMCDIDKDIPIHQYWTMKPDSDITYSSILELLEKDELKTEINEYAYLAPFGIWNPNTIYPTSSLKYGYYYKYRLNEAQDTLIGLKSLAEGRTRKLIDLNFLLYQENAGDSKVFKSYTKAKNYETVMETYLYFSWNLSSKILSWWNFSKYEKYLGSKDYSSNVKVIEEGLHNWLRQESVLLSIVVNVKGMSLRKILKLKDNWRNIYPSFKKNVQLILISDEDNLIEKKDNDLNICIIKYRNNKYNTIVKNLDVVLGDFFVFNKSNQYFIKDDISSILKEISFNSKLKLILKQGKWFKKYSLTSQTLFPTGPLRNFNFSILNMKLNFKRLVLSELINNYNNVSSSSVNFLNSLDFKKDALVFNRTKNKYHEIVKVKF